MMTPFSFAPPSCASLSVSAAGMCVSGDVCIPPHYLDCAFSLSCFLAPLPHTLTHTAYGQQLVFHPLIWSHMWQPNMNSLRSYAGTESRGGSVSGSGNGNGNGSGSESEGGFFSGLSRVRYVSEADEERVKQVWFHRQSLYQNNLFTFFFVSINSQTTSSRFSLCQSIAKQPLHVFLCVNQ